MKKIIFLFIFFVIIISIYTILFPVRLYKDSFYFVSNSLDINKKSFKKINAYYFYKSECGYFSVDGGFINKYYAAPDQYLVSNIYGYVLYNKIGDTINIMSPEGNKIKDISSYGYPYISGDFPFFYVIKTNGTGFFSYTFKGDEIFKSVDYTSIITSINSDINGNTLVSNLDGKTFLYSSKGEVLFSTYADETDSKVILTKSNAIDESGQNIALCTGLNPEYIEVYQVKNGKKIARIKTDTNFRFNSFLQFDKNRIYYESTAKLSYYDMKTKRKGELEIYGELEEVQFDNMGNILIISKDDEYHYLTIYNKLGYKKYYKEFHFKIDNLKVIDNESIYFKTPDNIVKVTVKYPA